MAETIAAAPDPITLPVDLDQLEDVLTAYAEEEQETPQILLPTLADAQRAARRLAEIRRDQQALAEVYDAEEQRLQQELEALRKRKEEALRPYERRASWYEAALEEFHRAELARNPKAKTIRLPAGDLCLRKQQPEWRYDDEVAVRVFLLESYPDAIRAKYEIDKRALKDVTEVRPDGTVALSDTGEVIPGLTVVERPPKFEFKPAD